MLRSMRATWRRASSTPPTRAHTSPSHTHVHTHPHHLYVTPHMQDTHIIVLIIHTSTSYTGKDKGEASRQPTPYTSHKLPTPQTYIHTTNLHTHSDILQCHAPHTTDVHAYHIPTHTQWQTTVTHSIPTHTQWWRQRKHVPPPDTITHLTPHTPHTRQHTPHTARTRQHTHLTPHTSHTRQHTHHTPHTHHTQDNTHLTPHTSHTRQQTHHTPHTTHTPHTRQHTHLTPHTPHTIPAHRWRASAHLALRRASAWSVLVSMTQSGPVWTRRVRCEKLHTIPCSTIHKIFWRPTHTYIQYLTVGYPRLSHTLHTLTCNIMQ